MSNVSQLNPLQFKKMYPNGAYAYTLVWGPDLEKVKDHFKKSVKSSAEGRTKWLQKQLEGIDGIAQCIVDKINKF